MYRIHVVAIALIGFLTPYLTLNQEAFAQSSQSRHRSLSGVWKKTPVPFHGDDSGCHAGSGGASNPPTPREITLVQNGTSVSIRGNFASASGGYNSGGSGEVRGNQFTLTDSGGGFTVRYEGTISDDGNTITGQALCRYSSGSATATGSFIWTRKKAKPTFHYFYINGLNTPVTSAGSGNCTAERAMVNNLLSRLEKPGKLEDTPCNPSGTEPNTQVQINAALRASRQLAAGATNEANLTLNGANLSRKADCFRRGNVGGYPLSLGDFYEAAQQSVPGAGTRYSQTDPVVASIVGKISGIYVAEKQSQEKNEENYFIIIAHSQGNFFAESVASNLSRDPEILKRIGVLALASPTSYSDVPGLKLGQNLNHFTRSNDAILVLKTIIPLNPFQREMKRPLPGNLPPLGNVNARTELLEPSAAVTLLAYFGLGAGTAVTAWNCLTDAPQVDNPNSSILALLPLYAHLMPNYLGEGSSDISSTIQQGLENLKRQMES